MNTRYERQRAYFLANRDHINALRRARRALLRTMTPEEIAAERKAKRATAGYTDYAKLVGSFTTGRGSRCGFSPAAYKGKEKIAARRREVYARMAKIQDGWRTK